MATKKNAGSKKVKTSTKVGLGVAAATAAAAAAGYYFYASKDAAKHRRKAAEWATKMKKEVVTKAAQVKKLNRDTVLKAIGQASKAYVSLKTISPLELQAAAKELKANWQEIKKEVEGTKKKITAAGKRVVRKAAPAKKTSKNGSTKK